eukprot:SAG22_NODE_302_length_12743_cov_12.397738_11_plen_97_part_00
MDTPTSKVCSQLLKNTCASIWHLQWYTLQHQEGKTNQNKSEEERELDATVAPEDVKDGFGETKNGDEEVSSITTLLAVGGVSRAVTAVAVLQVTVR